MFVKQKLQKKASTEEIARLAGISKSLLFHYFENKNGRYFYVVRERTQILSETGYMPSEAMYYDTLRVKEVIELSNTSPGFTFWMKPSGSNISALKQEGLFGAFPAK